MTGYFGHHAPFPGAPRSPGELTPFDVRWPGERLSWETYWRRGGKRGETRK